MESPINTTRMYYCLQGIFSWITRARLNRIVVNYYLVCNQMFALCAVASRVECHAKLPIDNKMLYHSQNSQRICDYFASGKDPLAMAYNNTMNYLKGDCDCPLFKSIFEDMSPTTGELEQKGYFTFNATSLIRKDLTPMRFNEKSSRGVSSHNVDLNSFPRVQYFIRETLRPIVQNYIGEQMLQGNTVLLKLSKRNLEKSEYISGMWHHDRCAKRVKCFIFLTDIDEESHPMRLISNTHKQIYFDYSRLPVSRLADEYALKHGKEIVFTGPAGHGFCFDTNGIHKGTLTGKKQRITLITEFHNQLMKNTYARLHVQAPFGK